MAWLIVVGAFGFGAALTAVLILIARRLRLRNREALTLYVAVLAGVGLVFGVAGVVAAIVSISG